MDTPFARGPRAPELHVPAELRAYWEAIRGTDTFPRRDRIDPRGLAGVLDRSFLIERIAPGLARFRIAGMRLADLMGMDLRGMPVSALILPAERDRFARTLEPVFATPSILDLRMEAERGPGRPGLSARMLVLPLGDRNGQPTLALGCLVTAEGAAAGRGPRRFAIASALRELVGEARASLRAGDEVAEGAPLPRPKRAAPHLRLVHDATRQG